MICQVEISLSVWTYDSDNKSEQLAIWVQKKMMDLEHV